MIVLMYFALHFLMLQKQPHKLRRSFQISMEMFAFK